MWWNYGVAVKALGVSTKLLYTPNPISTGMGDRLRASIPPRYITSHKGQLSPLPSAGWEMSTGQSAVMRCGWGLRGE